MPVTRLSAKWESGNLIFFDYVTGTTILTVYSGLTGVSFAGPLTVTGKVSGGTASFGSATDYTEFEEDGTMVAKGNATTFDDLPPVVLVAQKPTGAGADPALTTFKGNTKQYIFDVNDTLETLSTEVLHGYKEGSDITIHVHWATNGLELVDKTVKWQVEYTIANGSTDFGYAFGNAVTVSQEVTIPANTPDRTHCITAIGTITGTSIKIGAYIIAAVKRIASSGTEPAAHPFCIALGYHVEQDTTGSRQLYTKS